MSSRTLREGVSKIPVLVEPVAAPISERAAETFVPRPAEPASVESQAAEPRSDEAAPSADGHALSERERAVLAFEKRQWKHRGAKDQAILDSFGMSATRYYQLLNALLDRPEAQEFEPALVKRLRRLRAGKQSARSGRAHPRPA